VEAVRHFLGFADDSDARVGRTACWRRLVIVGELPQNMVAAEWRPTRGLGFAKHPVARVEGLRLAQLVVSALPLRMSAAGCGCCPDEPGQRTKSRGR
jgi:hypothetical protein